MRLYGQRVFFFVTILLIASAQANEDQSRDKKHFSLFSVVTFKNEECTSDSTFTGGATAGTCYTATECGDMGGTKSGNCASGFGVCCVVIYNTMASGTISVNRTYLRNALFPAVETAVPASTIVYTINKMQTDICQLRLDFENFVLAGPANTVETSTGTPTTSGVSNCKDQMSFDLDSGFMVPVLCGVMTGEHIYMDLGMESTDNAVITVTFAATATITAALAFRSWSIKTTQIPCWASYKAPEGCHRYLMQPSGQIASPNFAFLAAETPRFAVGAARTGAQLLSGMDLLGQDLRTCIRREKGMCCVRFQVCDQFGGIDLTNAQGSLTGTDGAEGAHSEGWSFHADISDATTLSATGPTGGTATAIFNDQGIVDAQCTVDYVEIPDSSTGMKNFAAAVQVNTRYCGTRLGFVPPIDSVAFVQAHVYDCTEPFEVNYHTDIFNDIGAVEATAATHAVRMEGRGLCLNYAQEAC